MCVCICSRSIGLGLKGFVFILVSHWEHVEHEPLAPTELFKSTRLLPPLHRWNTPGFAGPSQGLPG